ncbi:MAG: hypothetical protein JJ845_001615 [Prochlorococcus marinus CUG1436]|nr:hypothetical protein [Prochlorococcus marinus CUG1436]
MFFKHKAKPDLKQISLSNSNLESYNNKKKVYFNNLSSPDNRINVGKSFLINKDKYWYELIQLSFWRNDFFQLEFVEKQLQIKKIKNKKLNDNNYALGTFRNENISYACMENSKTFHHNKENDEIPSSIDFNYWIKVFKKNINFVFYAFKPFNYECILVLTSDQKFFERPETKINKIIFSKLNHN